MVQRNLDDRPIGWIQTKIEPSNRIGGGRTGIFMEINDHYELPQEQSTNPIAMMTMLAERWDRSIKNSEGIIDTIMALKK
jgi:hypothetical protein